MASSKVRSLALVVRNLLLGFNIMTLLLLWLVAACQWVSPNTFSLAGILCMTFPVMVAVNLLFIPLWLLLHARYVLVPLVGIAVVGGSVYNYCPVMNDRNFKDTVGVLRVVTYNTHGFGGNDAIEEGVNLSVQWMCRQKADIALLQEMTGNGNYIDSLEAAGYTVVGSANGFYGACILTRLPVIDSDCFVLPTLGTNGGSWARLQLGNDTLVVVNVHLESFGLDEEEKGDYRQVVRNITADESKEKGRALMGKMRPILAQHGLQADTLLSFVRNQLDAGYKVILGGDFNDVPNSYAVSRMRSVLDDCYREGGRGAGYTFNEQLMYFRIDHLFCSPTMKVKGARVDRKAVWSDHYPIIAHIAY